MNIFVLPHLFFNYSNMMRCPLLWFILFGWFSMPLNGSTLLTNNLQDEVFRDTVIDKSIHTVVFSRAGFPLSLPFIYLHSNDKLELVFDDLNKQSTYYAWELIHCTYNWTRDDLEMNEYMDGFPDHEIRDVRNSFNTTVQYRNHRLIFPVEGMSLLRSGNYVLRIYPVDDPDRTIMQKRFFVSEGEAAIRVSLDHPSGEDYLTGQSLRCEIGLQNPGQYDGSAFHFMTMQNMRWQAIRELPSPTLAGNDRYICCTHESCVFPGGNEYEAVDLKSMKYLSQRIQKIEFNYPCFRVILHPDKMKPYAPYYFDNDLNGKFLVVSNEASDSLIGADYAEVTFYLSTIQPFTDADVYIYGDLTGRMFQDKARMQYDAGSHTYQATLFLKQGYYNYEYVLVKKKGAPDFYAISGSHFETENDYLLLLYYSDYATRTDRLIGLQLFNTLNQAGKK